MTLSGKHLIGSDQVAAGTQTFQATNPATGELLAPAFFEGTEADIDRAARAAQRAFDVYRNTSNEDRARFLETIADEIMALGDTLIERTGAETALPEGRLVGERGRTVNQLRLFAEVVREGSWMDARIDTGDPERQPVPKPDVRSMMIGMGPVVVFGASNFPLAFSVAGGDTASALAAGCPVIVKGHPLHPGASELVGRAIQAAVQKCGLPEGTFSMIQGRTHAVGGGLVRHPAVKAVGFTGSFRGGQALFDLASSRSEPIPVFAEMGSTNPVFILPEALAQRGADIAGGLAQSTTLGVGQFCTNPGVVLTMAGEEHDTFAQAASDAILAMPVGTMLNAGIQASYEAGIKELTSLEDVRLLAESAPAPSGNGCAGVPRLLATTSEAWLAHPRMEEEVFGPSSLLVACASKDDMLQIAEALGGHLTATIHGTEAELEAHQDLVSILERKVGRIIFNGFPTGVEVCHAMVHGGPYPATTDSRSTSVGTMAIRRFLRPVSFQNFPASMLPEALKNKNTLGLRRLVNGSWTQEDI